MSIKLMMESLIKYPRTRHALFSEQLSKDDKRLSNYSAFEGKEIVVTIKLDGENTSLYRTDNHARSLDGRHHTSRDWVKGFWAKICYNIPEGWRICGENMFAQHSIVYDDLETYFYAFNVWNENNVCLSFDDTIEWCDLLGVKHVPVLWRGTFDVVKIENLFKELDKTKNEGIVVRKTNAFEYNDFKNNYFKAVRKGHVQTDKHWMVSEIKPNKLREKENNEDRV